MYIFDQRLSGLINTLDNFIITTTLKTFGAALVELVDTPDSKSCEHYARDGSSPSGGTKSF